MLSPNTGLLLIRSLALSIIAALAVSGRPAAAQPYASTTLVTVNPNVVAAGGQVTFSVSVAFNNTTGQTDLFPPTPGGQVQLYNTSSATGCTVNNQLFATITLSGGVGSAVINANLGTGVFCATSGVAGVNHISAIYVPDPSSPYLTSTGTTALDVTAALTPTSTTIPAASVNPVPYGQSVTVSATVNVVKVTTPYPSGSMNFLMASNCTTPGATILGSAPVQVNGTGSEITFLASIVVTAGTVAPGTVQIVACYLGDGNYQASSSPAPLSLVFSGPTLNQSTVTVSASLPPPISIPAAQPITLYGQVTSIGGTIPDGEPVTFYDNGATIGTGSTLNGQASMTVAFNTLGAHSITASYPGDANNAPSTSAALSITVLARTTTTTLTVSPNPANANSALLFSATVTPSSATGNVTFTSNSQPLGSAPVVNGVATFNLVNGLPAGSYTEAASFSPTDLIDASSNSVPVPLVVNPPSQTPTALSISIMPQSPVVGQSVTITIAITGATGLPGSNESVTVTVTSSTGTATSTVPLNSAWQAQVTNSYHSGPLSVTASYGGDPSNQGSTGSAQATVGLGSTTTSVSNTPAPSTFGQTATFTVTVAPVAPAMGTPTGSVSLTSDGNPIGTANLSGGTAMLPYSGLAAGTHTIVATYGGDGDFGGSTGQTSQIVDPSNTSTAFTSSLNPSVFGQPVTLTATVSAVAPGTGTPSGTVVIADGSNSSSIGLSNAIATWTPSSLSAGTHNLTATYGASPNFNSSSATLTQTVNQAGTTTTVTSSANPAGTLQSMTFTGTVGVSPPGMGVPTGTLTFMDGTNILCPNVTVTSGTGQCTSSPLPAGTHTITVTYSGDANFQQSSAIYTESVTTSSGAGKTPYLTIKKSVKNPSLPSGGTTTYVITISNRGSGAAGGVTMTDPLPSGLIIEALSQDAWHGTCTEVPLLAGQPGQIVCTDNKLAAGDTWKIAIKVMVTAPSSTTITNTASFTSVTPNAAPGPYSSSAVIKVQ